MSAAGEAVEGFIDVWAGEVRRLVPEVKARRQHYDAFSRALQRDDDWGLDEYGLVLRWQELWAAQHHLVWAAHQLERWVRRLAREQGIPEPEPDPVLTDLRNALEHLDEAELDEFGASPGEHPRRNRSLRNLPGGFLAIGTSTDPNRLFDLIDSDEIEQRALCIATITDRLEAEGEAWAEELMARGEWPPDDAEAAP